MYSYISTLSSLVLNLYRTYLLLHLHLTSLLLHLYFTYLLLQLYLTSLLLNIYLTSLVLQLYSADDPQHPPETFYEELKTEIDFSVRSSFSLISNPPLRNVQPTFKNPRKSICFVNASIICLCLIKAIRRLLLGLSLTT